MDWLVTGNFCGVEDRLKYPYPSDHSSPCSVLAEAIRQSLNKSRDGRNSENNVIADITPSRDLPSNS